LLTPKDAKEAFFLLPTPLRFLLEKMVEKEGIDKRVAKVEKENLEKGSIAYIFFQDGKTPSHVLVVRPGKDGQRASYLLSKPPREGESLHGMELHEVGSEFHAQILMDALCEDSPDSLSELVSSTMGYTLDKDGKWMMVCNTSGVSPLRYLKSSRMEKLERSKKIVGTIASLHSMGFGYDGGLSFEAVDFASGKAKARNPVKIYALEEHEKERAFFELVTTLARLGSFSKHEFSKMAKEYTHRSPVCRDIVGSYMKVRQSGLPMHLFVADMACKYSPLFYKQKQSKSSPNAPGRGSEPQTQAPNQYREAA
jgi:hypothetical protein